MKEKQMDTTGLLEAAKPLMKWMSDLGHPHYKVLVDHTTAELVESVLHEVTEEFLKD